MTSWMSFIVWDLLLNHIQKIPGLFLDIFLTKKILDLLEAKIADFVVLWIFGNPFRPPKKSVWNREKANACVTSFTMAMG